MHLPEQFRQALRHNRLIEPGDTVLVAVSGGLDSVVLLRLLHSVREDMSLHLHVGHGCAAVMLAQVATVTQPR